MLCIKKQYQQSNRQLIEWEKIFTSHIMITDEYLEHSENPWNSMTKSNFKKKQRIWIDVSQKNMQMVNEEMKKMLNITNH